MCLELKKIHCKYILRSNIIDIKIFTTPTISWWLSRKIFVAYVLSQYIQNFWTSLFDTLASRKNCRQRTCTLLISYFFLVGINETADFITLKFNKAIRLETTFDWSWIIIRIVETHRMHTTRYNVKAFTYTIPKQSVDF